MLELVPVPTDALQTTPKCCGVKHPFTVPMSEDFRQGMVGLHLLCDGQGFSLKTQCNESGAEAHLLTWLAVDSGWGRES